MEFASLNVVLFMLSERIQRARQCWIQMKKVWCKSNSFWGIAVEFMHFRNYPVIWKELSPKCKDLRCFWFSLLVKIIYFIFEVSDDAINYTYGESTNSRETSVIENTLQFQKTMYTSEVLKRLTKPYKSLELQKINTVSISSLLFFSLLQKFQSFSYFWNRFLMFPRRSTSSLPRQDSGTWWVFCCRRTLLHQQNIRIVRHLKKIWGILGSNMVFLERKRWKIHHYEVVPRPQRGCYLAI